MEILNFSSEFNFYKDFNTLHNIDKYDYLFILDLEISPKKNLIAKWSGISIIISKMREIYRNHAILTIKYTFPMINL